MASLLFASLTQYVVDEPLPYCGRFALSDGDLDAVTEDEEVAVLAHYLVHVDQKALVGAQEPRVVDSPLYLIKLDYGPDCGAVRLEYADGASRAFYVDYTVSFEF